MESKLEMLADIQHDIWSHWMKYMFSKCVKDLGTGELIIPKGLVDRWKKQMNTDYRDLTQEEKQSDRDVIEQFYTENVMKYLES